MAIQYINSGDTNNQGRLKINATWDEIITGTTLSSNDGEYLLDQFGGGQISGQVKLPSTQSNQSLLIQVGPMSWTSSTIYATGGEFTLAGNQITITAQTPITLQANATSLDRYDSVYLADDGSINVVQGTPSLNPEIPDFVSGGTEWAYFGSVRVLANGGGYFLSNQALEEYNDVGTQYPEYIGGLSNSMLGGWTYKISTKNVGGADVLRGINDNAMAFGKANRVYDSNSSAIAGQFNQISGSTGTTIFGGSGNTITDNNNITLVGGLNINDSGKVYKEGAVILPHTHNTQSQFNKSTLVDTYYDVQDDDYIILVETTPTIINLPSAPLDGRTLKIKDGGNAHTGDITISGITNTIDGSSTFIINSQYESVSVFYESDLGGWWII